MATMEMYCTNAYCRGAYGVEVGYFEGSYDPPIAPELESDTCPLCDYNLVGDDERIYPDEIQETLESSFGYSGPLNISRDVDLNKIIDVVHQELRRQEREKNE